MIYSVKQNARRRAESAGRKAASAEAPSKVASPSGAFSVTGGSMSVAEAVAFCLECDKAAAQCERLAAALTDPIERTRWRSHADNFAAAAKNMRRRMDAANVRQPTSNAEISHDRERKIL